MYSYTQYFLAIAVLGLNTVAGEFPEFIKKCSRSDPKLNECIIKNGNIAIPVILKGIPSLNIPRLIPFELPEFDLKITDNLRYILSDGSSTLDIDGVKITYADLNYKSKTLELIFELNFLSWNIAFLATGNILEKPIKEQGRLNLTFSDLQFNYTGDFEIKDIDGKDYMQFVSGKAKTLSKSFKMIHYNQKSVGDKITDAQQEEFLKISKGIILSIREQVKSIGDNLLMLVLNNILKLVPEMDMFDP